MSAVERPCCTSVFGNPHVAGCAFEPRPDDRVDYSGLAAIVRGEPSALATVLHREISRHLDELHSRADLAELEGVEADRLVPQILGPAATRALVRYWRAQAHGWLQESGLSPGGELAMRRLAGLQVLLTVDLGCGR